MCEDVSAYLSGVLAKCGWVSKSKDIGIRQKRWELMKVGSGESHRSLGGEGVIKNRRAFWWDVIWFLIDTRPSLIGLCCESDGSQAQLSLDQIYADVSLHHQWPFWKWWPMLQKAVMLNRARDDSRVTKIKLPTWYHCQNIFPIANQFIIKRDHSILKVIPASAIIQNIYNAIHFIVHCDTHSLEQGCLKLLLVQGPHTHQFDPPK